MKIFFTFFVLLLCRIVGHAQNSWIRINQLGYTPKGVKVAVFCSKEKTPATRWNLVRASDGKKVAAGKLSKSFGAYGPFLQTERIDFSTFNIAGKYYLTIGEIQSPLFEIGSAVYNGMADFCLYYMRQQRSKYNPVMKDSCHTADGFTLYGPMPDSTRIDVSGGWHDATDYLQYSTTSANATFHLLAAYRDFGKVFGDAHLANGLAGVNQVPDILDEAKWGLDWLLKMHPREDWMFNQIADDRDHIGLRMPGKDSVYGRGYERPVYFVSGEPQIRGRSLNNTTGRSSTAGKFSSAFSLGAQIFKNRDEQYASILFGKAESAYRFGLSKPGVTQTASVKSPYIYAEENWMDDMELAAAVLKSSDERAYAFELAVKEPVTPWLGMDTAAHYQWYPFINLGHFELAKRVEGEKKKSLVLFYREGISKVWLKAQQNAFYRGVPFIWCSNNLTTAFAIQCYWYRILTGDTRFAELEQANFDWLFGCNPWGTSMVYGLPATGDSPSEPHASFSSVGRFPVNGGLVDGPVYGSIYNNLIGIKLTRPDEYALFQSGLAVYHDDIGDYSTNEPTMDGTASLIYLLAAREDEATNEVAKGKNPADNSGAISETVTHKFGAIVRGDSTSKKIALVFTGHEFADGGFYISDVLKKEAIQASFFLTGTFYRNIANRNLLAEFKKNGHYLGPHSDAHLLYCDWSNRDSLLVDKASFEADLKANLSVMAHSGIDNGMRAFFLPAYEWYNDSIAAWAAGLGQQLINFTPGTLSTADYTTPDMKNYRSSDAIMASINRYEQLHAAGLNGFILLLHVGTDPLRTDKMYYRLPDLIQYLKTKGYQMVRIDELLP